MSKDMKILVVDDSSIVRKIIRQELEEGGYEIIEAKNGLEALTKATLFVPNLVTLDVQMPKLNGFDTCRKFNEKQYARLFNKFKNQRVPVIFITSHDTIEDRKKGFELGAADFIIKPFEKGKLLETVNKILNPKKRSKNLSALIVDDSPFARKVLLEILTREGLHVIEAEEGLQAFELMNSQMAKIDIVITDLLMPRMNGIELTKKIRNELNMTDIPIIFLTCMEDQAELLSIFKAGATDYLVKPFFKEELIARINVHLEKDQLNKRLRTMVGELQNALAKVKTLSGLLPICASCKKIRDDKGYWNQIELYIQKNSEAEFTHGICPECLQKLYPDYCKKINSKNKSLQKA
jgi:two-component system cell cycle response regulator